MAAAELSLLIVSVKQEVKLLTDSVPHCSPYNQTSFPVMFSEKHIYCDVDRRMTETLKLLIWIRTSLV